MSKERQNFWGNLVSQLRSPKEAPKKSPKGYVHITAAGGKALCGMYNVPFLTLVSAESGEANCFVCCREADVPRSAE